MTKYAKYISETRIEFPPKNKGDIINYDRDYDQLIKDGYKEFIEAEKEIGKSYNITYKELTRFIKEIATEIIPDPEEVLRQAKQSKKQEANYKAKEYLESGEAVYEFTKDENIYHIEATDGNIAKIGLKATSLLLAQDFITTFPWNTKEDINIELNALEGKAIAEGLGGIQDIVWTLKYPEFLQEIEQAQTIEEVNDILIDYESGDQ